MVIFGHVTPFVPVSGAGKFVLKTIKEITP
jgi:hypothetical protein